jgi:type IV secretion system protein VirB1
VLPEMEMMNCRHLAVPAVVMRHIVRVESGANPYAIGVVGGRLLRQPKSLHEAEATVRALEAKGHSYSLGMAQVHRANLGPFGLDTYEKAFDTCSNLAAASRILADCYGRARGDWGKAFSCYYSGDFVTGFRHGYVRKVFDSIHRDSAIVDTQASASSAAAPAAGTPAAPSQGIGRRDGTDVFIPQVRGPADPPAPAATPRGTPATHTDRADLREEAPDAAFVF